jgi:predicted DNA-binding transcriptional regulator YafY
MASEAEGAMRILDIRARLTRRRAPARRPAGPGGLSRRDLAAAAAAAMLPGAARAEGGAGALAALDRAHLAGIVRGLAGLTQSGDPALVRQADRLLAEIALLLPEAPVLHELHLLFPPGRGGPRRPLRIDLAALHGACHAARPVSFDYVDLQGAATSRRVLPLELVHPGHGILLLAWCELRGAERKFFVHAMDNLRLHPGDFGTRRLALLQGALAAEFGRRYEG